MERVTVHIATKDRHSECALLLQSLRTQTYQKFDILIVDDASGSPVSNCGFIMSLVNRIKFEGHKVRIIRNEMSYGVCFARNMCIDQDTFKNYFTCRLDDDCIIEQDYLERLIYVIHCGYDLASGVIPLVMTPLFKIQIKSNGSS